MKHNLSGHTGEVSNTPSKLKLLFCLNNSLFLLSFNLSFFLVCVGKVYAVDWSPDGEKVASGGADRALKLWRG